MQTFKYIARTSDGREESGIVEAFDELDATTRIRTKYEAVVSMKEITQGALPSILTMEIGGNKLDPKAFTLMCSQFATILKAGIPIVRAVKLIGDKTTNKLLHKLLENVAEDVDAGRSVSASFAAHGDSFLPPTFVETIGAGEEAGDMAGAFESVYKHYDKQTKMSSKVRRALSYPVFVLALAVAVVIFLMAFIVPKFTAILDDSGGELPIMTSILIAISNFFRDNIIIILFVIALIVAGFMLYGRTERGKERLARIQLDLPVLGNIAQLNAASLFANTMATMIGAGLPMTKSVAITSSVMENYIMRTRTQNMVARIEEGRTVSDSMREAECFPDILVDMVGVGEDTGDMKETLDTVAQYYDNELEQAVAAAVAMIEPGMLIFIAVVVGFIVISIYSAMFAMYQSM